MIFKVTDEKLDRTTHGEVMDATVDPGKFYTLAARFAVNEAGEAMTEEQVIEEFRAMPIPKFKEARKSFFLPLLQAQSLVG
jgi:hypothetical protein